MCQLDALKRLKCERHIVMKALKNLPKTLDETYDRIFTTIPEEERLFVHHVLQWIAYHNEMYYGDGMPCEVLIQAAIASTYELTGERNERFYDKDTLREICGCLIDISPQGYYDLLKASPHGYKRGPLPHYMSVTFAHYTVREYLDSGRMIKSTSAYCSSVEETLKERFIGITMSEAQNMKSNELWSMKTADDADCALKFIEAVHSDFTNYCVVSGILSLHQWPGYIGQQSGLARLTVDLLDPSKPHFETMRTAASAVHDWTVFFDGHNPGARFWEIAWLGKESTKAKHLYLLLYLYQFRGDYAPLVKEFLQEEDNTRLLQTRLQLTSYCGACFTYRECVEGELHLFDGTFFEVFAQPQNSLSCVLSFLMEVGAGMFDPSVLLLLYIGGHRHGDTCEDVCPVQRLLDLGADPNLKGYIVTPLQIATYCSDVEGVDTLLKHGAHPNSTGCSNGVAWEEDTLMGCINHLHGHSPLRIYRKYIPILEYTMASEEELKR